MLLRREKHRGQDGSKFSDRTKSRFPFDYLIFKIVIDYTQNEYSVLNSLVLFLYRDKYG